MAHRRAHRRSSARPFSSARKWIAALITVLVLGAAAARDPLQAWTAAPAEQALRAAWQDAQGQPGYRFTSDVDQTLVPIAGAEAIGREDQALTMVAEGAVRAPDQAEVRIALGGQPMSAAMGIVQDGPKSFLRQGDKLLPVESPAGAAAPTGDYLAFLAGAVNVREIEPTTAAGHRFRRFAFDLDGERLSEHLRRELQRQLGGKLPPGVRLSPVPLVAQMTGSGTLWVDETGLPRRQTLDLTLPRATADYGARMKVSTEFRDFGRVASIGRVVQDGEGVWRLEGADPRTGPRPPAPSPKTAGGGGVTADRAVLAQQSGLGEAKFTGHESQDQPGKADAPPPPAVLGEGAGGRGPTRAITPAHLANTLLLLLSLLIAFSLSLAFGRYRRRRATYATIVAVTVVALVGGPFAQVVRVTDFVRRFQASAAGFGAASVLAQGIAGNGPPVTESAPLPGTDGATGPAQSPAPAAVDHLDRSNRPAGLDRLAQAGGGTGITACGQGSSGVDTDGDGLSDFEEGCRGTDPNRNDTDADLIPDGAEVAGFSVGGETWYGNPNAVDAGGDGLIDSAEWPTPVGKGPRIDADGDGTATDEEAWDPDGDGMPNIWDDDNDGDGVPDSADLSPFSRTALLEDYTLSTQGGGTDGHQYIELQVRPEDPDRLRYNVSALDWPSDEEGQMKDLDNSSADLRLFPMLEVLTNVRPDTELARRYGLGTVESVPGSPEPYRLYAPLLPVADNGRIVAFYARVAYPPAQQSQIRWNAKMVWVAQAQTDEFTGNSVRTDALALQTYEEPMFQVTGATVSRSQSFESALLGTPSLPDDDRQLFNLLFGMNAAFTSADNVSLADVVNRFTGALTLDVEKWGVTATVAVDRADYVHHDEGISDTAGRRLTQFLNAHYSPSDTPSVLIAFEERSRAYNVDQVERLDPGSEINVNLADTPLARTRGLQLNLYQAAGAEWRTLPTEERDAVIAARYADVSASLAALQPTYPGLTAVDLQSVVRNMYDIWATGRTAVMTADGLVLTAAGLTDAQITALLDRTAGLTLDAYLIDVARLAEPGGGLRMGNSAVGDWQYIRANINETKMVGIDYAGLTVYTFRSPQTGQGDLLRKSFKVVSAAKDLVQLYQATQAFNNLSRSQQILYPLTRSALEGRTLGVVGVVLAVGLIWVTFGLTTDFSNPIAVKIAVATAIVATAFTILMFVISLNPVGLVLTALFYLIDLIVFFATSGEFSLTDTIVNAITRFFYDVKVLTEVEDARFGDVDSGLFSPEYGLRAGNLFFMTSEVQGVVKKKSDGDLGDLRDSYVTGRFDATSARSEVLPLNFDKRCTTSDSSTLNCRTAVGAGFVFRDASRDVDMSVDALIQTKVFYDECTLQGAFCSRKSLTDTLPEDREPSEMTLDVLPANMGQLWAWDAAPVVLGHVFNPDLDGDARLDSDEIPAAPCTDPPAQQCTRSDNWDTDGDTLPDGYEASHSGKLGLNPAVADTDGDGLSDAEELRRHTSPADPDTDGDGLSDGEEVFQAGDAFWQPGTAATSVGGWLVRLPGGPLVPVMSDPLRADSDGDGLTDATERTNQTSPFAPNIGPVLIITASPMPPSPAAAQGMFVLPGTAITLNLELLSVGKYRIDQPLELCLPSLLSSLSGGDLTGASSPIKKSASTGCGSDPAAALWTWPFSASEPLALGDSTTTTITGVAGAGASATMRATIGASLPYRDDLDRDGNSTIDSADLAELTPSLSITVDADDPIAAITTPLDGAILGGGTTTLVIGGTASDAGSWVTELSLTLPAGGGTATATGISPWSYAWTLPADGVHTLSATAEDAVGHTSTTASATVTVDNTAPTAAFTSPADGAFISDPSGQGATVTVSGTVADNLSGVQRLQIQIDDRAWVPVALVGGSPPDFPTSASWSYDWRLPGGNAAQGRHTVRVRAFDRANNQSVVAQRAIIVDVLPPADGLTNRRFETDPPSYGSGQPVDLQGLANDAGNAPLAPRPAALEGTVDSLGDATVWLSPDSVAQDDGGISATWLGDFNGDRLADLAVGLPAAAGGAGRVAIVYGRPGGFALPPTPELIGDSPTSYVGEAGAGIGAKVSAVGDANGDGLDDMLIGDPTNGRVHLVFGRRSVAVPDAVLNANGGPERVVLSGPGLGAAIGAAGDTNGDGMGDLLVGIGAGSSEWVVFLGKIQTAWQPLEDVTVQAAAVVDFDPGVAPARGVGDMDGDGASEFVVADPTGSGGPAGRYYLYRGDAMLAATERRAISAATSYSSSGNGTLAALGDVSGDGRADFVYNDGTAPKLVFGSAGGNGNCCLSLGGYTPAASGFLAAVGDVDVDAGGLGDLLVGAADGSAYLLLGQAGLNPASSSPAVAARITDVAGAAPLAPLASADANADGSADLVLIPGSGGTTVLATSYLLFGRQPHIATDALPRGVAGDPAGEWNSRLPLQSRPSPATQMNLRRPAREGGLRNGSREFIRQAGAPDSPARLTAITRYVDDDWAGTSAGADPDGAGPATSFGTNAFATIQAAVNAGASGDTISVLPGVYAGFEVTGAAKNDLTVAGVDPDAVFVNGASFSGSTAAAYVHDVTGVSLERLTLRNADRGLWLENAGVGGYTSPLAGFGNSALRIELSRVLVQDCAFGVYSDRESALAVSDSTIAARGSGDRHVRVDPSTPDAPLNPAWSTTPPADLGVGDNLADGGSVQMLLGRVRALLGGGSREFWAYDPPPTNAWSTRPSPPLDVVAGSATTVDQGANFLYLMSKQDRFTSVPGVSINVADPRGINTFAVSGTSIYAGGEFVTAGGVTAHGIARYDTAAGTWHALGQGLRQLSGVFCPCEPHVDSIAIDSGGNIYVGGFFDQAVNGDASTVATAGIAKWNGSTWSALGGGLTLNSGSPPSATAMVASGTDIYVGGNFDKAGGITVNSIAKWNGSAWSALGGGLTRPDSPSGTRTGFVWSLSVQGSNLYIAGNFDNTSTDHIIRWDGSAYQSVGPVASGLNYLVGMAFVGSELYVSDEGTGPSPVATIRHLTGGSWQDITPVGLGFSDGRTDLMSNGGKLYTLTQFYQEGRVGVYDGATWRLLGGNPLAFVPPPYGGQVWALAFIGADTYVGGSFTSVNNEDMTSVSADGFARMTPTPRLLRYPEAPTWNPRANPPRLPEVGATLAADGADAVYATFGGGLHFNRYNIAANSWTSLAPVPATTTTGAASAWAGGKVYLLPGDSTVNSSAAFYRFTPDGGMGTWTAMGSAPFDLGSGANLEWDGSDDIYAVQGGNGRTFARYSIAGNAWTVLGSGGTGLSTPGGSNPGGGLALDGPNATLYFARGGGTGFDKISPIGVKPEKLTLDRVAFVTPENTAAQTWLNTDLLTGSAEPADYLIGGTGSTWVAGVGTSWTPSGGSAPLPMTFVTTTAARFLDPAGGVLRVAQGTVLTAGYHDAHADAHVFTSMAACAPCALPMVDPDHLTWGTDAFDTVQAAIDTGAPRVLVHSGSYAQAFHLVTGVQVIGAGAGLSVITPPPSPPIALARAEGIRASLLARLTLAGSAGVDGARFEDGARSTTLSRSIVRDSGTGVRIQGAATDLDLVNNTFARNGTGLAAETCAPVDVRNTIFASHTSAGLSYQSCAATKLHTYNDYFGNAADLKIDGSAAQAPGVGEIFADPAFTDPAPPANDFRPTDGSPVIDAGNPSDPVPPGAGGRVDIGYVETGGAAFFADDDYCEFCDNDGLFWQVDAFDVIGDALDAAANEISALGCGPASVGGVPCDTQWTVGVGPGTYPERVVVPSHVSLVGTSADEVTIDAGGSGVPVTVDSGISVDVRGLTLTDSVATGAGVVVDAASSGVHISRNLIIGNAGGGVIFAGRSSGTATFNTVVGNTGAGYLGMDSGTWFEAESSIVSGNGVGLRTTGDGQVFDDFNLVHGNGVDYQDDAATGLVPGPDSIVGQAPGFVVGGSYALTPTSPAVDAADPLAEVPPGGGARADMGYLELVAAPLALLLGQEGISAATGNSGIQSVEVGFRRISDPTLPITDTASLPTTWLSTTLATPDQTTSYWTRTLTPSDGDGLYRVYSRALDRAGNRVDDPTVQFRGSFTLDTAPPVVTWLSPSTGVSTTSPLELRAQVADYVAGEFNVEDFGFEVDSLPVAADWAPEPWDPTSGAPRVFRAWVSLGTGPHTARAVATDRAGNSAATSPSVSLSITGTSPLDGVAPTGTVTAPADGAVTRADVTFTGTVADTGGSGVAGVELSLDGGRAWTPATVTAGTWSLDWTAPDGLDHASFPMRVRALDRAGNVAALAALAVTIDSVAPAGVAPLTFSLPVGSHLDEFTDLDIAWTPPQSGGDVAEVRLAVDQAPSTTPVAVVAGQTATRSLDAPGDWYVHIATADQVGNTLVRHFGPWHVGTVSQTTFLAAGRLSRLLGLDVLTCEDRRQTIDLDGVLELDLDEWRDDTEKLAADERSGTSQTLYFTWDGVNSFLGWQGARWVADGTMFAYFDVAAGGTTTPMATTPGGTALTLPALPFAADYAVAVDGPATGGLWRWNGSAWTPESLPAGDFAFAHGEMAGTELRLPWGAPEVAGVFRLFAFAVGDAGTPTSVFPTVNASDGPWSIGYAWSDRCNTDPTTGIPRARLANLSLNSPQSALAPWGHDMDLDYVMTVENPEADPLVGAQVELSTTPGLGYQTLTGGATCGTCPVNGTTWTLDIPPVAAKSSTVFTATGRLASVLAGIDVVTTTARLDLPITPSGASILERRFSHRVDSRAPAAGAMLPAGTIGPAGLELIGEANDGDGIGVDFVEVRVNGGPWVPATGKALWTKPIVPPSGATSVLVEVRATDYYGQVSVVESQSLVVDDVAPGVPSFVLPPVIIGDYFELGGTAADGFPAGGALLRVEVQIDDENGPWLPAILNTTTGTVTWLFTWDVPDDIGGVHRIRVRAVDAAGNVGPPTAWQETTTFPRSPVDAGPDLIGTVGVPVQFLGSFTPWGSANPYFIAWDFGDGATQSAVVTSPSDPALSPTHAYSHRGTFEATLSVTHDGTVLVAAVAGPPGASTRVAGVAGEPTPARDAPQSPAQAGEVTVSDTAQVLIFGGDPTGVQILSLTAAAVGRRAVIAWTTGPEAGVAGFVVYRSAGGAGPWTRVNAALIAARGGTAGGRYDLVDAPGLGTFRYRLEVVHDQAPPSWHGPVAVAVRGGPAPGEALLPWVGQR